MKNIVLAAALVSVLCAIACTKTPPPAQTEQTPPPAAPTAPAEPTAPVEPTAPAQPGGGQ